MQAAFESVKDSPSDEWQPIPSKDPLVRMECRSLLNAAVGRATAVIDETVEICAIEEFQKETRARLKRHHATGLLPNRYIECGPHSALFHFFVSSTEFLIKMVWLPTHDGILICEDDALHPHFPVSDKYVRGKTTIMLKYERLPPIGDVPQTRVTLYTLVGGVTLTDFRAFGKLNMVIGLRKKYDKSITVDEVRRAETISIIEEEFLTTPNTSEEQSVVEAGYSILEWFESKSKAKGKFTTDDPLVRMEYLPSVDNANVYWGMASATVKDSPEQVRVSATLCPHPSATLVHATTNVRPPAQVLAHFWFSGSRNRINENVEALEHENVNDHCRYEHYFMNAPPREVLLKCVFAKINKDTLFLGRVSREHARWPTKANLVDYSSYLFLSREGAKRSRLDFLVMQDCKSAGKREMLKLLQRELRTSTAAAYYFQSFRSAKQYDQEDGLDIGEEFMLLNKNGKKKPVHHMFETHRGLKEIASEHVWVSRFTRGNSRDGSLMIYCIGLELLYCDWQDSQ